MSWNCHFYAMATALNMKILALCSLLCIQVHMRSLTDIDTADGQEYFLKYYGFAKGWGERSELTDEDRKQAIRQFQEFNGLPVTGEIDAATKSLMLAPRCDLPDKPSPRTARFAIRSTKWTDTLRWKVNKADKIGQMEGERIMREAVQEWQKWMMTLQVTQSNDVDSEIRVEYVIPDADGNHGDGLPFATSTLAHALYPGAAALSGDVHFNMNSPFSAQNQPPDTEYAIKQTAVHELGHALGLKHSNVLDATMYPYARRGVAYSGLHEDDILGIATLYGKCHLSPCQNGGTCNHVTTLPGYRCTCLPSHTGTHCELEEKCLPDPCRNGGTCTNNATSSTGYICQCSSNYTGSNCELASNCQGSTCKNGGTCKNVPEASLGYTCLCPASHMGNNCETVSENKCATNPCQNGGTCKIENNNKGYSCKCPNSYKGVNCDEVEMNMINAATATSGNVLVPLLCLHMLHIFHRKLSTF